MAHTTALLCQRCASSHLFIPIGVPVPQVWGMLLALPYVLTRGVLPIVSRDLLSAETLQAAFLWGWLAEAGLLAGYIMSANEQRAVALLQSALHMDQDPVGRELHIRPGGSGGHAQRGNVRPVYLPGAENASAAMEKVLQELRLRLSARNNKAANVQAPLADS